MHNVKCFTAKTKNQQKQINNRKAIEQSVTHVAEHITYQRHLFLVVLDRQFESCQVVVAFLIQQVDVISVVEDHLKFPGAARLVKEVLGKLFALLGQLLILRLELILNLYQKK